MIKPSFQLEFVSATLAPSVNFTRSDATATRVNNIGYIETLVADTPRFDFDPVLIACKGLLIEESRINICTDSKNFSAWAGSNQVTWSTPSETAPDAAATVDKMAAVAVSAQHYAQKTITVTNATTYTASVYVKASGLTRGNVLLAQSSSPFTINANANFNLATGIVTPSTGTATIQAAGNGWYRITVTGTTTGTGVFFRVAMQSAGGSGTFTGNGVDGLLVWGAQLEAGAFATSYIPTTTTALTRNADVATITGTNFSDFWQASKGGVLVRARPGTVTGTRPWVQYDDGTADNIITLRGNTTNPELYIVDGGTPQAQIDAGTIAANTDYNLIGWWQTNDCKARLNNGAVVTDTTATIPTVTQARLGSDGTNYLNGHLASISYYDTFSQRIYTRRKNKAVFNLM
jgi:hypothetical protein